MLKDLITADEAFKIGLKKYFTGIACKRGHICERWVSSHCCVECKEIHVKSWQQRNKQKLAAYKRESRKLNPEKVREQETKYRQHDREARKARQRIRAKTYAEKNRIKQVILAGREKPNECEICGDRDVRICYDHCHTTGLFRGWLCVRCNSALGLVRDNITILEKLKSYLSRFEEEDDIYNDQAHN